MSEILNVAEEYSLSVGSTLYIENISLKLLTRIKLSLEAIAKSGKPVSFTKLFFLFSISISIFLVLERYDICEPSVTNKKSSIVKVSLVFKMRL